VTIFALALGTVLVLLFMVTEVVAAAIPLLIVITLVPVEERRGLAEVLAAADHSRRLRLWSALRLAVKAGRHRSR
jgi:putative exporter of polyketide antibiotics